MTQNDVAWKKYLDAKGIQLDGRVYDVDASDPNRLAREARGIALTLTGMEVVSAPVNQQRRVLAKAVVNSWIFSALLELALHNGRFTMPDIEGIIASTALPSGKQRYSRSTITRRRRTIVAWAEWLTLRFNLFTKDNYGYSLSGADTQDRSA